MMISAVLNIFKSFCYNFHNYQNAYFFESREIFFLNKFTDIKFVDSSFIIDKK